jgi:hypothetical protein
VTDEKTDETTDEAAGERMVSSMELVKEVLEKHEALCGHIRNNYRGPYQALMAMQMVEGAIRGSHMEAEDFYNHTLAFHDLINAVISIGAKSIHVSLQEGTFKEKYEAAVDAKLKEIRKTAVRRELRDIVETMMRTAMIKAEAEEAEKAAKDKATKNQE